MKYITLTLLYCITILIGVHVFLGVAMYHYAPAQPISILNVSHNEGHSLGGEFYQARQAIYGTPALATTKLPKLIFIGGSSVVDGFRIEDWHKHTSDVEVHNVAITNARLPMLVSLWPHIERSISKNVASQSTVVLGLMFAMFTDVQRNLVEEEDTPFRVLHWLGADLWGNAYFWNFIKLQTYRYFALKNYVHDILYINSIHNAGEAVKEHRITYANPSDVLIEWQNAMGGGEAIEPKLYDEFEGLVKKIRDAGFRLIVVDMPLPHWHVQISSYDKSFSNTIREKMVHLMTSDKGIYFIDMHTKMPDSDFLDSVHPSREAAKKWSEQLQQALAEQRLLPKTIGNA